MTKKNSAQTIADALEIIAKELTDVQVKTDKDGQPREINILGYAQKRVLNGIAYSAALTLQRTQQDLDDAKQKVIVAARSHRGDEISEQQLNRTLDWAERLEMQEAVLSNLLQRAMETYERHTGDLFQIPAAKPAERKTFSTAAMDRAKRFAVGSGEVVQSKGTGEDGFELRYQGGDLPRKPQPKQEAAA